MKTTPGRPWQYWCMLGLLLVSVAAHAAPPPLPRTPAQLQAALEAIMREEGVPGMGVVVASEGEIVLQAALGVADVVRRTPVSEHTRFRLGDISKSFVGLALLKLQEQGKLKVTDTLRQWAPELAFENAWERTDPVRLVHLLEHTSGLDDMRLMEYADSTTPPIVLKAALESHAAGRKARWRPGSRAAHNSVGPALAAYVVEKVSGQRFEDYVAQNFFAPLGMASATYFEPRGDFAGQYAGDGVTALPYWHALYRPSTALNASLRDMSSYLLMLLNQGRAKGIDILAPASIARLERPETLAMAAYGIKIAPALGILNTIENGLHFRGHFGIVNGGLSDLLYVPEARIGAVVMMNSLNEIARARVLGLLQAYLAQGVQPATARAAGPPAVVEPELLDNYAGYYLEDSPASERMRFIKDFTSVMQVMLTPNGMQARDVLSGYTEQWVARTGRTFGQDDQTEPMVALFREQDGELVMQSKWGTLRKVSALRAFAPHVIGGICLLLMLSSPIVSLVQAVRWLTRRKRPQISPRIWLLPMAASITFFGIALTLSGSMNLHSLWAGWGTPTPVTVTALVAGWLFVAFSLASVISVSRYRPVGHAVVYWYSTLVSVACLVAACYLLYWKAIGIPTWWL